MPCRVKGEQPGIREESVGPAHLIGPAAAEAGPLLLHAQESAEPSPDQTIEPFKDGVMGMLEVVEPTSQNRVETADDPFKAVAPGPLGLLPDFILEPVQALLADMTPFALEAIAKKAKALPLFPAVPDMGLVRVKAKAVASSLSDWGFAISIAVQPIAL